MCDSSQSSASFFVNGVGCPDGPERGWAELYASDPHMTGTFGDSFAAIKWDLGMTKYSDERTYQLLCKLFQTNLRLLRHALTWKFFLTDSLVFKGPELRELAATIDGFMFRKFEGIVIPLDDTLKRRVTDILASNPQKYARLEDLEVDMEEGPKRLDRYIIEALVQSAKTMAAIEEEGEVDADIFPFNSSEKVCKRWLRDQDFLTTSADFLSRSSRELIFREAYSCLKTFTSYHGDVGYIVMRSFREK